MTHLLLSERAQRAPVEEDAVELLKRGREWAAEAEVLVFRCAVDAAGALAFVNLDPHVAPGSQGNAHGPGWRTS